MMPGCRVGYAWLALTLVASSLSAQDVRRIEGIPTADVVALTSAAETIYAATSDRIYAGTDADTPWEAVVPLPDEAGVVALLAHGGALYAGTSGAGVFVSRNGGQSWDAFSGNLSGAALSVEALVVRGDSLYAGTNGAGVFVIDLQQTASGWQAFNQNFDGAVVTALGASGRALVAMAGTTGSVRVRPRVASNWTAVPLAPNNPQVQVVDFAVMGEFLFAGTNDGLFRSGLDADQWLRFGSPGEEGSRITALTTHGGRLYAATRRQGYALHYSDDAGSTWTTWHSDEGAVHDLRVANDHLWIAGVGGLWGVELGGVRTSFEGVLVTNGFQHGTVMAVLDGADLRLFGSFYGLAAPWSVVELRRGAPGEEGELIKTLVFSAIGAFRGGGFDQTHELTEDERRALYDGLLSIRVRLQAPTPENDLRGQILLHPVDEIAYWETPLNGFGLGQPNVLGGVMAALTGDQLKLAGFFVMSAPWGTIDLIRGLPGAADTVVTNIWVNWLGLPETGTGFDAVRPLTEAQQQALHDGLLGVRAQPFVPVRALRGQLLALPNAAPAASQITAPADGAVLYVGTPDGPVDPSTPLATIVASPAEDPNGNPVAYIWQASIRPSFLYVRTVTMSLGVDSTTVPLTVGSASALADSLTGGLTPGASVVVYHRMVTTDGARFTIGPTATLTFVRESATPNEPVDGLPAAFRLHGNYPNPFNPSTTITVDLPERAEVTIEVYDMMGRRLLAVAPRQMAAGEGQRIDLDGSALASGTYVYRVVARSGAHVWTEQGRMTMIK